MQFPPYDFALDEGRAAFESRSANGTPMAIAFPTAASACARTFPYFDTATGEVVTLDLAINRCPRRTARSRCDIRPV